MGNPPLTKQEIAKWLQGMGDTDTGRISHIKQLLKYKVGDLMSREDEAICQQELCKLIDRINTNGSKGYRDTKASGLDGETNHGA